MVVACPAVNDNSTSFETCVPLAGLVRAIDLAFEHFAHFGRDDEIIDLLGRAIEDAGVAGRARQRFAELCASHD